MMTTMDDIRQIHAIILMMSWPGTGSLPLRKRDGGRGERSKGESSFGPASAKLPSGE